MPSGPGQTLRMVPAETLGDMVGVEREALAGDLDLATAAQRHEDLLLAVFGVVVLGVVLELVGMSMICMPNDSTPSSARARLNEPM